MALCIVTGWNTAVLSTTSSGWTTRKPPQPRKPKPLNGQWVCVRGFWWRRHPTGAARWTRSGSIWRYPRSRSRVRLENESSSGRSIKDDKSNGPLSTKRRWGGHQPRPGNRSKIKILKLPTGWYTWKNHISKYTNFQVWTSPHGRVHPSNQEERYSKKKKIKNGIAARSNIERSKIRSMDHLYEKSYKTQKWSWKYSQIRILAWTRQFYLKRFEIWKIEKTRKEFEKVRNFQSTKIEIP